MHLSDFWRVQKIASIWPKMAHEVDTSGCQDCRIRAKTLPNRPQRYPRYILYPSPTFPHDRIFDDISMNQRIFRLWGDGAKMAVQNRLGGLSASEIFMTTHRDKSFRDDVFLLGLIFSFQGFCSSTISGKYISAGKSESAKYAYYKQ